MYIAALILPTALVPLNRFPIISHYKHIASEPSPVILPMADEKFYLTKQQDNILQKQMNITFVIEVINEYGYTHSIKTSHSNLAALQTTSIANSWIPTNASNYTIKAFVLSDPQQAFVIGEPRITILDAIEFTHIDSKVT